MTASKWGNAAPEAVEAAKAGVGLKNGDALDARQRETAKGDVRALLTAGKTKDAVLKLMELIE